MNHFVLKERQYHGLSSAAPQHILSFEYDVGAMLTFSSRCKDSVLDLFKEIIPSLWFFLLHCFFVLFCFFHDAVMFYGM